MASQGVPGCAHARSASLAFFCTGVATFRGAGHAVAPGSALPCGWPGGMGVSRPRRETATTYQAQSDSPGLPPPVTEESGGNGASNPGAVSRSTETLNFPICSVPSHRMAMRRHLGVRDVRLRTGKM